MNNKLSILFLSTCIVSVQVFGITGHHADITSSNDSTTDNGETCVYCHTPHSANSGYIPAPLWNKPLPTTAFRMYGATTDGVAGQTMGGTSTDTLPSGSTLACLSCHDGVSAMNSVVNAPGPGGYNINGSLIGTYIPTSNTMNSKETYVAVGIDGSLTDDHPVSIEYIPGKAGLRPLNTPVTDILGAEKISDLLKDGKVQCTSCHDPHGTIYDTYLRSPNTNSSLCLACHEK